MLYNRCTGIYKFGNNTYHQAHKMQVEFRSHFWGGKSASYGPGNTVISHEEILFYVHFVISVKLQIEQK